MSVIRIVDVTDEPAFRLIPPCADPGFDHRTCDYWEDAERGSKASRLNWLEPVARPRSSGTQASNPFAPAGQTSANPFAASPRDGSTVNPFLSGEDPAADNPFIPRRSARPTVAADAPRKLSLLGRGLAVFGSYAKVLLVDDQPAAYAQFGPLSAYPRALRQRELYRQLPKAPLPAVITCIATTAEARGQGHARRLVAAVCQDLAGRGFAAVEAYPEIGAPPDATSAATPAFWVSAGFSLVVDDERFPVVRMDLG